jgi:2-isopropylmalate synthase
MLGKARVFVDMQDEITRWTTVRASTNTIAASWIALADAVEYGLSNCHAERRGEEGSWKHG